MRLMVAVAVLAVLLPGAAAGPLPPDRRRRPRPRRLAGCAMAESHGPGAQPAFSRDGRLLATSDVTGAGSRSAKPVDGSPWPSSSTRAARLRGVQPRRRPGCSAPAMTASSANGTSPAPGDLAIVQRRPGERCGGLDLSLDGERLGHGQAKTS